jgi:hypothetical protein
MIFSGGPGIFVKRVLGPNETGILNRSQDGKCPTIPCRSRLRLKTDECFSWVKLLSMAWSRVWESSVSSGSLIIPFVLKVIFKHRN